MKLAKTIEVREDQGEAQGAAIFVEAGKVRTKLSRCLRKLRFGSLADASAAASRAGLPLRPYRCDRCRQFHLTSRTKGKRVPRPD